VPHWTIAAATTTTTSSSSSNPFSSVTDFFKSPTFQFIEYMMVFFLIALWLACAYWVFKDARRRVEDRIILIVCVLTGLVFGPLGLFIYTIVRPAELIVDKREREMEMEMMAQRLGDSARCSFCKSPVRDDYLVCPICGHRLRSTCASCGKPLEPNWRLCPYCEADVLGPVMPAYDRA